MINYLAGTPLARCKLGQARSVERAQGVRLIRPRRGIDGNCNEY